jgi:hypothetical protein
MGRQVVLGQREISRDNRKKCWRDKCRLQVFSEQMIDQFSARGTRFELHSFSSIAASSNSAVGYSGYRCRGLFDQTLPQINALPGRVKSISLPQ